jgi:hypothetical protein
MTLPSDLLTNQSKQVIVDYQLDHGRQVQGKKKKKKKQYISRQYFVIYILVEWSQPFSTKQYSTLLCRLYSPV